MIRIQRSLPLLAAGLALAPVVRGVDPYSIGSPTGEEQLFVEYINRARADATAEGIRLANTGDPDVQSALGYFGTNMTEMINQFAALPQQLPPLSISAALTSAARLHTQDMFTNIFQGHFSSATPPAPFSPGDTTVNRVEDFGYVWSALAENVFAVAKSALFAHAAFNIDWGTGPYGMQDPAGHRLNIHNAAFREIGVGVVQGINANETFKVGPLLVTQDFGSQQSPLPFVTGVAYYDLNQNNFYDIGEGLGGVNVTLTGTTAWAQTAASGGYSVPVPGNGTYSATFSGPSLSMTAPPATVTGGANVKVDLKLSYPSPDVAGTATPSIGNVNGYAITTVPGATAYRVLKCVEDTSLWLEGAETGTTGVTITQSPGYAVIQSEAGSVKSGIYSFHLAHPVGCSDEIIELNQLIVPSASSQIQFASRLGYATSLQYAVVEVSVNGGANWTRVYYQAGTSSAGETSYVNRTIDLGAYADIPVKLRFRYYTREFGFYYNQIAANFGWLIDNITVTFASRLNIQSQTDYPSPGFTYTPAAAESRLFAALALNNSRAYPYGRVKRVTSMTGTPLELWRQAHFSPADLGDPSKEATIWGDDADPDKDSSRNLMEFALNGDPKVPDIAGHAPQFSRSGSVLKLNYIKRQDTVIYRVRTNTDLGGWTTTGVTQTPDPATAPVGTPIEASVTLGGAKRFLQLEVTRP